LEIVIEVGVLDLSLRKDTAVPAGEYRKLGQLLPAAYNRLDGITWVSAIDTMRR